jgi:hypothetical protein
VDTLRAGRSDAAAESQIERFITQRHEKRLSEAGEGERREEEMWRESVARYNERERRQMRARWYGWHCDQADRHRRTLEALIAHHEGEAQKLLGEDEPAKLERKEKSA